MGTFQTHFVWRTVNSSLIIKVRRDQDIIFVYQDSVIMVKSGLENGQQVFLSYTIDNHSQSFV